jgi:uncharacterized tellurite resistance protein B-like protein
MDRQIHAALSHPKEARLDYLRVLAALVGADTTVRSHELGVLREFCDALDLTPSEANEILAFVRNVRADVVRETCERLKTSELRFTLVSDLLYIAHTDATYAPQERELIETIARLLGVSFRQLEAMDTYAQAVLASRAGRMPGDVTADDAPDDARANTVAGLAAAGVPLAAVMAAGAGVGPTSIASGLAVLGMGAMSTGAGVAALLGVGSFMLVRMLIKRVD